MGKTSSSNAINGTESADTITGTSGNDVIYGLGSGDSIYGEAGSDFIVGGEGDDVLDGGLDHDHLDGGAGNDTFVVDNALDTVIERVDGGTDTVLSSVDYQFHLELENLTLTGAAVSGTGNYRANEIVGNASANTLDGREGDDTLAGGIGADVLTGGLGSDTFAFSAGDGADTDHRPWGRRYRPGRRLFGRAVGHPVGRQRRRRAVGNRPDHLPGHDGRRGPGGASLPGQRRSTARRATTHWSGPAATTR